MRPRRRPPWNPLKLANPAATVARYFMHYTSGGLVFDTFIPYAYG
jgi:hypothetical protein